MLAFHLPTTVDKEPKEIKFTEKSNFLIVSHLRYEVETPSHILGINKIVLL